MTKTPFSYKLPLRRFDVTVLPANARTIGSDAFKNAVIRHFVNQYAAKGETAIVTIDDDEISVVTLPTSADPLDFVLTLLRGGRIKEAVPILEAMNKVDPNNVKVLYNLGIAYSELGQFDEAIIRLKDAVRLNPKHAHAWTGIGVAYQRMGNRALALEPLQRAVEADPSDGYARRNLGGMLASVGRTDEALAHLRAARQALPDDPQSVGGVASVLEGIGGDENLHEADLLFSEVIKRWPDSPVAALAREARTRIAGRSVRSKSVGGLRPDVMMYITGALEQFAALGPEARQQIALEIAMKGQEGLDVNDPDQKYTLKSLPGRFSGMQLIAIMYTAFRQMDPSLDTGIDLRAEYDSAIALRGSTNT